MNFRILLIFCLAASAFAQKTTADNTKPAPPTAATSSAAAAPDPLLDARALMNKQQYADPAAALVHAAVGDVAFRAGRFADSETEYRTALKLDPNSARGQFGMGRMLQM